MVKSQIVWVMMRVSPVFKRPKSLNLFFDYICNFKFQTGPDVMETAGHCFASLFMSTSSYWKQLFSLFFLCETFKNQNVHVIWKVCFHLSSFGMITFQSSAPFHCLNRAYNQKIKDINICLIRIIYHTKVFLEGAVNGITLKIRSSDMGSDGSLIHCFCLRFSSGWWGWTETQAGTVWYSPLVLSGSYSTSQS